MEVDEPGGVVADKHQACSEHGKARLAAVEIILALKDVPLVDARTRVRKVAEVQLGPAQPERLRDRQEDQRIQRQSAEVALKVLEPRLDPDDTLIRPDVIGGNASAQISGIRKAGEVLACLDHRVVDVELSLVSALGKVVEHFLKPLKRDPILNIPLKVKDHKDVGEVRVQQLAPLGVSLPLLENADERKGLEFVATMGEHALINNRIDVH